MKQSFSKHSLQVGLVDETAGSKEEAIKKCETWFDQFKKVSPEARSITKQALRATEIRELEENRDKDVEWFVNTIQQPYVQKILGNYLESLK